MTFYGIKNAQVGEVLPDFNIRLIYDTSAGHRHKVWTRTTDPWAAILWHLRRPLTLYLDDTTTSTRPKVIPVALDADLDNLSIAVLANGRSHSVEENESCGNRHVKHTFTMLAFRALDRDPHLLEAYRARCLLTKPIECTGDLIRLAEAEEKRLAEEYGNTKGNDAAIQDAKEYLLALSAAEHKSPITRYDEWCAGFMPRVP